MLRLQQVKAHSSCNSNVHFCATNGRTIAELPTRITKFSQTFAARSSALNGFCDQSHERTTGLAVFKHRNSDGDFSNNRRQSFPSPTDQNSTNAQQGAAMGNRNFGRAPLPPYALPGAEADGTLGQTFYAHDSLRRPAVSERQWRGDDPQHNVRGFGLYSRD